MASDTRTEATSSPTELAPGIHGWRAVHPEWHTTTERVASYALQFDDGLLLVDPLLAGTDEDAMLQALQDLAGGGAVHAYITIPYHVRDAERIVREIDGGAQVWGHRAVAERLADASLAMDAAFAGTQLPFGVQAMRIGNPVRNELPLWSPTHRALAFGDAVVGVRDGLRVWHDATGHESWFRGRFLPTLQPLADLDVDHVLVTHGQPVIGTGRTALRGMLRAAPVPSLGPELSGTARL